MHMADALVSPAVGMAMNAISVAAIVAAAANVKKDELAEKKVPIMGVAGALVFAGQMINFTIPATGSSGHIGGGILLAGLLGGVPAFLSIAAVLIIQCLFFADGGLLALGSNIFNLGVIPCLFVYPLIFKPLIKGNADYRRLPIASVAAVIVGLQLGALCVVLQTLFSGITALPFGTFAALMMPIHLAIGIVEGIVTAAVLCFVYKMRPEIIDGSARPAERPGGVSTKKLLIAFVVMTVVVGGALSLFVSANPDGLEWAIGKTTYKVLGEETELEAVGGIFDGAASLRDSVAFLPDYAFTSDPENAMGTSVSGIFGAAITFIFAGATGFVISRTKKRKKAVVNV
ncbi:MAG: energy-coupling factor ABC transporter permease [Acidobacteriota bacterium]|jgi:cobalt/nickel transport system permease protein|nr:energy-coupling factor ABC transporter permease [Acidobacteriota bacterium]